VKGHGGGRQERQRTLATPPLLLQGPRTERRVGPAALPPERTEGITAWLFRLQLSGGC
jgi:hypothetical protein